METIVRNGMRIAWDIPIAMDDGATLYANLFLPEAEDRYPVLVTHGPYGKDLAFHDGHFRPIWEMMTAAHPETAAASSNRYQVWETPDPERWTRHGYACLRVDSRGAGKSPGVIDLLSAREIRDYAECIQWAGEQPWSNGKVGLNGISYYAINQWLVASLQPKHLAAMFAFEGAADCYRDMSRHGGILTTFWNVLTDLQINSVQYGLGPRGHRDAARGGLVSGGRPLTDEELATNRVPFFERQKARELEAPFYRERSPDWSRVAVPFVSAGSWGGQGLHLRGNTEAFVNAASEQKYLEMHGLEHWTQFYTDYGFDLQKRFFDRFLKGEHEAWPDEPRVRLHIRHPGNHFETRFEAEWPLVRTEWARFYLDADALRLSMEPKPAESTATYGALGDGLTFLSDPFEQPTEMTGPAAACLKLASSTSDADLFLVLRLFASDMKEVTFIGSQDPLTPLSMGWLRASHRKADPARSRPWRPWHTHDEKWPLTPHEPVTCEVEIWPFSIVIPAGYRLGLSVRGRDFVSPHAKPQNILEKGRPLPNGVGAMFHNDPDDRPVDVFGGNVKLYSGGKDASHILLPIIPPA